MRVLHVCGGNLFGGVESLLLTLVSRRTLCPGMETRVAVCFEGTLSDALRATGSPPLVLGAARISRPWTVLRARRQLRVALGRHPQDAVVCHAAWPQALFGPVVRRAGLPLVFWLHHAASERQGLDRWASRTRPDLAICNSRHTALTLPGLYPGVPAEVLFAPVAAPTPILPADREALRASLGAPPGVPVVVQASRLEAWKGHALLLEALGRLRARPWACWIAGGVQRPLEERYLASLRNLAGRLGIADRVRFLGQRGDVPRVLASADLCCQPNAVPEPFGIVFIEAMHAGLPVVTTAQGGALEILDASCGVLTPPGDPEALAAALEGLLGDPPRRARMGEAGRERAAALCDPAAQMGRLERLLAGVAGKGARA